MHPRWRHVPPILSWSTSATFRPSWAARNAAVYPPVPAPSTTRSKSLEEPTAMGQGASDSRRSSGPDRSSTGRTVGRIMEVDGTRAVERPATEGTAGRGAWSVPDPVLDSGLRAPAPSNRSLDGSGDPPPRRPDGRGVPHRLDPDGRPGGPVLRRPGPADHRLRADRRHQHASRARPRLGRARRRGRPAQGHHPGPAGEVRHRRRPARGGPVRRRGRGRGHLVGLRRVPERPRRRDRGRARCS